MLRPLISFGLLVALPGCLIPSDPPLEESAAIPTDHRTASAVIHSYTRAVNERDLNAYVALLEAPSDQEEGFVFIGPPPPDLEDVAWIDPPDWSYELEVATLDALFDPGYRDIHGIGVRSIDAEIDIVEESMVAGATVVQSTARIRAHTFSSHECIANSRLYFTMVVDDRGYLRIREMREFAVGYAATWTTIKSRYCLR